MDNTFTGATGKFYLKGSRKAKIASTHTQAKAKAKARTLRETRAMPEHLPRGERRKRREGVGVLQVHGRGMPKD